MLILLCILFAISASSCHRRDRKHNPENVIQKQYSSLKDKLIDHPEAISSGEIKVVVLTSWESDFDTICNASEIEKIPDSARVEIIIPLREKGEGHYMTINRSKDGKIYAREFSPMIISGIVVGRADCPYGRTAENMLDVPVKRDENAATIEALQKANEIVGNL